MRQLDRSLARLGVSEIRKAAPSFAAGDILDYARNPVGAGEPELLAAVDDPSAESLTYRSAVNATRTYGGVGRMTVLPMPIQRACATVD